MKFSIKLLYLYLFSIIGLIITVVGTVQLVDLGIKVFVFRGADKYEYIGTPMYAGEKEVQERESVRQRQRQVSTAVSMIIVGLPLYLYHWRKIRD